MFNSTFKKNFSLFILTVLMIFQSSISYSQNPGLGGNRGQGNDRVGANSDDNDQDLQKALTLSIQDYEYGDEDQAVTHLQQETASANPRTLQIDRVLLQTQNCEYQISTLEDAMKRFTDDLARLQEQMQLQDQVASDLRGSIAQNMQKLADLDTVNRNHLGRAEAMAKRMGGKQDDYLKGSQLEEINKNKLKIGEIKKDTQDLEEQIQQIGREKLAVKNSSESLNLKISKQIQQIDEHTRQLESLRLMSQIAFEQQAQQ